MVSVENNMLALQHPSSFKVRPLLSISYFPLISAFLLVVVENLEHLHEKEVAKRSCIIRENLL